MSGGFRPGSFLYKSAAGGSAYDDTAVLARLTTLEASIQWNLNSAAAGSAAGPTANVTISSLSATKRSFIRVTWTQSGAALTASGIEMEPNATVGDGDSTQMRITNAGGFTEDLTKSYVAGVNILSSLNNLDLTIDPVAKIGSSWHTSGLAGSASNPRASLATLSWSTAGITSIKLTCITASATMTTVAWKVWTET